MRAFPIPAQAIAEFCKTHAVRELALFGSVARGEADDASDVDVLIDLRPEARIGLVGYQQMRDELAILFVRPVDLVTRSGLNHNIREAVLREARVVYAE